MLHYFDDNPSTYPSEVSLNLDLIDYTLNFYRTMELQGFWVKINPNYGMVLPESDGDSTPQLIPYAETLGLKMMYREKDKTYCNSPNHLDSNRVASAPVQFLIPDGTAWVYYIIVTKYSHINDGLGIVSEITKQTQIYRTVTGNEADWAKTPLTDYSAFKSKV
jgi:hypothetical protein